MKAFLHILYLKFLNSKHERCFPFSLTNIVRIKDLGKLYLVTICRVELIATTAPAASNNGTHFKSDRNRLENNHLEL